MGRITECTQTWCNGNRVKPMSMRYLDEARQKAVLLWDQVEVRKCSGAQRNSGECALHCTALHTAQKRKWKRRTPSGTYGPDSKRKCREQEPCAFPWPFPFRLARCSAFTVVIA